MKVKHLMICIIISFKSDNDPDPESQPLAGSDSLQHRPWRVHVPAAMVAPVQVGLPLG